MNLFLPVRRPIFALILFLFGVKFDAFAYSSVDVNTIFSAFNSAFYYQNGTNAYFKNNQTSGNSYFWTQANMIESVIDAYEWTSNPLYAGMITNLLNGFITQNGTDWLAYTPYNDDVMWAVMAFARGGVDTGKSNYINLAKSNFDACYVRGYDTRLGGGMYWNTDKAFKNAAVNGPCSIAAYLLYQIYGDINYWNKSTNIYYWERSVLFNPNTGAIADGILTSGTLTGGATTYNQGTFIGAAHFIGQTNDAMLAANWTMANMNTVGILPEQGIAGNNSGFNAIFQRWMMRFIRDRGLQSTYRLWFQTNAAAAWNVRRTDNLSWCQWLHPSPAGTNFYSWDCISSVEALFASDPTQTNAAGAIPRNYVGYWPLDASSGLVAADSSGNGNNGNLNGAVWTNTGRFNGCLAFNGVNSSVQITNTLANDFSIVFWVRTTQTAGTGQWYNGRGLVDGDYPGNNNDFGTALVGGKFAFGVGNPDTTILSTSVINDGAWHLCAATRQQINGAMNVFVDGVLQATGTGSRNSLTAPPSLLFGAIASGGGYFNGSLDEVRIFNRTLTSSEIAALFSSTVSPPPAAPAGLSAQPGNAQVVLNWPEAPAATSYSVKRSLYAGGPYTTIATVGTNSYTDTTPVNNRSYFYVVSALNSAGESTNSMQASGSPIALVVWLKADAIPGLANGAGVAAWNDLSGNGYNAIQTLSANRPTYVTNAINGLPVVRFNSASSSYLWFFRPVQDDFTMSFVYQSSQGISTGTDFWNGAGLVNGEQSGTVDDFGTSLNANGQILAGTGRPDTTIHSGTGFNNGLPHVVTFKRTKSTGATLLYVDGVTVGSATGGTQSLTSPNFLVLGGQGVLNNFLSGDIAEVRIYNSALSDTDRLGLERALKCKYNLSGATTLNPPTGLTGTAGNRRISLSWVLVSGATDYNLLRSTDNGLTYQLAAGGLVTSSFVDTNAANDQVNYYKVSANDACGAGANSSAVGIFLPLPALTMNVDSNSLALSWPGWASDWKLYSTPDLTPPAVWTWVTNVASSNAGVFSVTLPIGPGNQYFRLSSP
jgi:predicted alpha-1,6-mannanase (GH76 family)